MTFFKTFEKILYLQNPEYAETNYYFYYYYFLSSSLFIITIIIINKFLKETSLTGRTSTSSLETRNNRLTWTWVWDFIKTSLILFPSLANREK